MTQTSSSESGTDELVTVSDTGSRALVLARDVYGKSRRERRRRQLQFILIVLLTLAASMAWGALVVRPRYAAETRFSVRGSADGPPPSALSTSLLSSGAAGSSGGAGFVDGFAVNDFIKSRDAMTQLAKRVNLNALLNVSPQEGNEALYKAYLAAISARFNLVEQENVIEVSAFTPDGSRKIAEALLALSQDFVGKMDAQGVENTLTVDGDQLRRAQDEAMRAANAVAAWRIANRNVDPEAEAAMVLTMIGQIETELNAARINYAKVRAMQNPDHPMLVPAQMQVAALEKQLADMRGRLAAGTGSQADRLKAYSQLKNAQTFADSNLTASRDAYNQAIHEMNRLRRYVGVIARPVASDVPTSPNMVLFAIEGLLGGLVLAFLASLATDLLRPRRY